MFQIPNHGRDAQRAAFAAVLRAVLPLGERRDEIASRASRRS